MGEVFTGFIVPLLCFGTAYAAWYGWYQRLFPELSCYRRFRNRMSVLLVARHHVLNQGVRMWVIALVPGGMCFSTLFALNGPAGIYLTLALGLLLMMVIPDLVWLREMRKRVRCELVKRGVHVCLSCGYDLRGNVSGRCPECGGEVR